MHGQGDAGTVSDEDVLATGEGYVIAGCTSRGVNFNSFSASVFSGASQWYQRAQKAFGMHSTKLALSAAAASPASSSDKEDVTAACCYEQYALEQERLQQISDKMWNEQLRQLRLRQVQWRVESWNSSAVPSSDDIDDANASWMSRPSFARLGGSLSASVLSTSLSASVLSTSCESISSMDEDIYVDPVLPPLRCRSLSANDVRGHRGDEDADVFKRATSFQCATTDVRRKRQSSDAEFSDGFELRTRPCISPVLDGDEWWSFSRTHYPLQFTDFLTNSSTSQIRSSLMTSQIRSDI
jgi:hypothetical protein